MYSGTMKKTNPGGELEFPKTREEMRELVLSSMPDDLKALYVNNPVVHRVVEMALGYAGRHLELMQACERFKDFPFQLADYVQRHFGPIELPPEAIRDIESWRKPLKSPPDNG